jgi:hypothetical protein
MNEASHKDCDSHPSSSTLAKRRGPCITLSGS